MTLTLRVAVITLMLLGCDRSSQVVDGGFDLAPVCRPSTLSFSTTTAAAFAPMSGPAYLASGDFNGDGRLDFAVSNYKVSNVSVHLGHGDGSFAAGDDFPVGNGGRDLQGLGSGDFTGDGILDLVAANTASQTVTVLRGDGNGRFTVQPSPHPTGVMPEGLISADFNRDGRPDVALALGDGTLDLLLGDGQGGFASSSAIATPLLTTGDFNGDGIPDVAGGAFSTLDMATAHTANVVLGKGDGSFALPGLGYPVGSGPDGMAAGDFDGDRRLDLVVESFYDNAATILLGTGDGSFSGGDTLSAGSGPDGLAVGDLDCDGKLDLVVANSGDDFVSLFRGNGDGSFAAALSIPSGMGPGATLIADFDGDGRADILLVNYEGDTVTLLRQQ